MVANVNDENLTARFGEFFEAMAARQYLSDVLYFIAEDEADFLCVLSDVWERVLDYLHRLPQTELKRKFPDFKNLRNFLLRALYNARTDGFRRVSREKKLKEEFATFVGSRYAKSPLDEVIENEEHAIRQKIRRCIADALQGKKPSGNVMRYLAEWIGQQPPADNINLACQRLGVKKSILFGVC